MLSRDGGAVEMNLPPLIAAAACAPSAVDGGRLTAGKVRWSRGGGREVPQTLPPTLRQP